MKFIIKIGLVLILLSATFSFSQVKIKGEIFDEYLETFAGATIKDEYNNNSVKSNKDGSFSIKLKDKFPQKLFISAPSFITEEVMILNEDKYINIILKESLAINDVVVSASRLPEKILESPVAVLNYGERDIKNSIGSAYESLGYMPGVQMLNNYNGFKSINTRGFGQFDNNRFVQLIDGMDSFVPASFLNQGDLGLPIDLDLQSIEILPGAASALYGANAYNGLMLINTLSPFDNTGIDVSFNMGGINRRTDVSTYNFSIRQAYRFSSSFAAKATFSYEEGEQWEANDYRNIDNETTFVNNKTISDIHGFNGINVYGDENIRGINLGHYYQESEPNTYGFKDLYLGMSRTGFSEQQLIGNDFKTKSIKFNTSLNLRPFTNKNYEFIFANNISTSDKIVQESLSRVVLNNFYMLKSKLEFKSDNFFLRFSRSANKTDKAYDLYSLGYNINETLMKSDDFIESYGYPIVNKLFDGGSLDEINFNYRRELSDYSGISRDEYNKFTPKIKSTLITKKYGSKIYDESGYINVEGNYNLSKWINNIVNFQVGGSYRKYKTNSKGTIFNDENSAIKLEEYGIYTQIQKKFYDDRLKLTGSIRYDKNILFKANISPKIALNYALGTNKNHVFRMSFQTGFRNPNMQELYSNRRSGAFTQIIGSASNNNISLINNVSDTFWSSFSTDSKLSNEYQELKKENFIIPNTTIANIMANSFVGYTSTQGTSDKIFAKNDYEKVKPEQIQSIELGYRSLLGIGRTNLDISINSYVNKHDHFISLLKLTTFIFGDIFPKGDGYFTDEEINDIKADLKDSKPFLSSPLEDGKRQYLGSDVSFQSTFFENMYRETSMYTNMRSSVFSYGYSVAVKTTLFNNKLNLKANYSFMDYKMNDKDNGLFNPSFNSPKHVVKLRIGHHKIIGNLSYELGCKWLDKYQWKSEFASTDIPQRILADGELNYGFPSINSIVKLGATNLLDQKYNIAPGSGNIGSTYYISFVIKN